jgi:hypothetical protein
VYDDPRSQRLDDTRRDRNRHDGPLVEAPAGNVDWTRQRRQRAERRPYGLPPFVTPLYGELRRIYREHPHPDPNGSLRAGRAGGAGRRRVLVHFERARDRGRRAQGSGAYRAAADGPVLGVTMLTVKADGHPVMGRMHRPNAEKRSVVILRPADYDEWLHTTNVEAARSMLTLHAYLHKRPAGRFCI